MDETKRIFEDFGKCRTDTMIYKVHFKRLILRLKKQFEKPINPQNRESLAGNLLQIPENLNL